jgi:DNA-binding transcriptional LysR family regulator
MHISQPALSIEIRKLEDILGLKLFDRAGNRISLNENGKILYGYTSKIFDLVTQAEYKLLNRRDYITGTIQLGASNAPGTYIFPNVIAQYKGQYPGVNINLNIGNTSEIAHYINNGTLDFAVNGGSTTYHKDISVEVLYQDKLMLVVSPGSEYAALEKAGLSELDRMSFIVHKTDSQLYTYYKNLIESYGISEKVSITLSNLEAIKHAVMAGIGVSLIPYISVRSELRAGLLVRVPLDAVIEQPPYPYSLVYNINRYLSPAAERFIGILRQYMKNMQGPEESG